MVDIEELRVQGNVYDSLNIEMDRTYVTRRLSLSDYGVLSVLDTPIIEEITDVDIELFEGDNYIYLLDMEGNYFYAEYVVKNNFTNIFPSKAEMNSSINQTAQSVEISVNQKLTEYSTTEEMNAAITAKADEINLEVSKKVDDEKLTGANIALRINNDTSEATINADKININGAISANGNFKVDTNGNMTCKNATIDGKITSKEGTIAGFTIGENLLSTDKYGFNSDGDTIMWVGTDNPNTSFFLINRYGVVQCNTNDTGSTEDKVCGMAFNWGNYFTDIKPHKIVMSQENATPDTETIITRLSIVTPKLTQTSLASSKKNLERLENALDIIKKVDIYKYNLKTDEDGTKKGIGFVIGNGFKYAEELTSNDNSGANIYSLASVCVKAIQEQQEEIRNLKIRIEQLEKEV